MRSLLSVWYVHLLMTQCVLLTNLIEKGLWKVPNDVCADTVYEAIKAGYRMFDSASDYGNEHESGKGLKRALDEGLVKREELFIVSKLWNTYKVGFVVYFQRRSTAETLK